MDDGEIDFSNHEVFSDTNMADNLPSSSSMESFFEEILKDTHACTHTHTCNPPGPDNVHTHTCFHTHTKIVAAPDEEKFADTAESPQNSSSKPKKQPAGNREAVRKYREKKKARTACLEEEVLHLTALNQQLMRRLQGQAAFEAEIARLKCLLADFRCRIDGELGVYPYKKSVGTDKTGDGFLQPLPGGYVLNSCNVHCDADVPCLHPNFNSETEVGGMQHEPRESSARCNLMAGHCQALKADAAAAGSGSGSGTVLANEFSAVMATTINQTKGKKTAAAGGGPEG